MELEELQNTWAKMSLEIDKQNKLSKKIILEMTQQKYQNRFSSLIKFEMVGAIICFVLAVLIILNFSKLNTWQLIVCGIITLLPLIVLPILTLKALKQIKNLAILDISYKDALIKYLKAKDYLLGIQQFGAYASLPIFFTSIPVMSKILKNKDFFATSKGFSFYILITITFIGLIFFIKWGIGCYKRITNSAEKILKSLEE